MLSYLYHVETKTGNTSQQALFQYHWVGSHLPAAPTGSKLDRVNGVFYWQPGPGFAGRYRLLFLQETGTEQINGKEVIVEIK